MEQKKWDYFANARILWSEEETKKELTDRLEKEGHQITEIEWKTSESSDATFLNCRFNVSNKIERVIKEQRCPLCNKLLYKYDQSNVPRIEIKCHNNKCKTMFNSL